MANETKKTFVVDIKECQNNTWQGSIHWVQANKSKNFRSTLELIKLIDSVVEENDDIVSSDT